MPTTILDGETYEQARHRRFTEEAKVIEKMQQDEIIRMAREVDAITGLIGRWIFLDAAHLERFAALVAAHEREACAKVCEEIAPWGNSADDWAASCLNKAAKAIRARNNND